MVQVLMPESEQYRAGLARYLRGAGIEVVEVDRPNRQARRRTGKSDPADAVEAVCVWGGRLRDEGAAVHAGGVSGADGALPD